MINKHIVVLGGRREVIVCHIHVQFSCTLDIHQLYKYKQLSGKMKSRFYSSNGENVKGVLKGQVHPSVSMGEIHHSFFMGDFDPSHLEGQITPQDINSCPTGCKG